MNNIHLEKLKVSVDGNSTPLPDWARAAVELGAYARYAAESKTNRLIICCVVPCRDVFTALVGLGSVIAGGHLFRKGFTWEDLMSLEPGTEIFWKVDGENHNYVGVLEAHQEISGQVVVPVTISKPVKKKGILWSFTESKFRECIFSEERLPSNYASDQFSVAEDFYRALGVAAAAKWLMTAGAEVRFVSKATRFRRVFDEWSLRSDLENTSSSLDQLLILKEEADTSLAKARITHHLGSFVNDCPVSIIDGPLAFQRIPDIDSSSLVVILERGELAEEHVDFLWQAHDEHSSEFEQELVEFALTNIPKSVEVTGYCLRMV